MLKSVQDFLNEFRDHVINEAKRNAPTSMGKLKDSIRGYVKESPNSIQITFEMEEYGWYQDQGVKGANPSNVSPNARIKGQQAPNSRFKFGSGTKRGTWSMFVSSIEKWAKRRNIRFRNEKGQYAKGNYKSLAYVIARNIYSRGLKPSLFFTKPFEQAFKQLPNGLVEKYGLEAEQLFDEILNENFKQ